MRIVRLKPYLRAMKAMGLDEDAMRGIEAAILAAPEAHPMIKGLRGVRKVRFALPGRGKGGGGRAIYYAAVAPGALFMLTAIVVWLWSDNERAFMRVSNSMALALLIMSVVLAAGAMVISLIVPAAPDTNRKIRIPGSRFMRTPLPKGARPVPA